MGFVHSIYIWFSLWLVYRGDWLRLRLRLRLGQVRLGETDGSVFYVGLGLGHLTPNSCRPLLPSRGAAALTFTLVQIWPEVVYTPSPRSRAGGDTPWSPLWYRRRLCCLPLFPRNISASCRIHFNTSIPLSIHSQVQESTNSSDINVVKAVSHVSETAWWENGSTLAQRGACWEDL